MIGFLPGSSRLSRSSVRHPRLDTCSTCTHTCTRNLHPALDWQPSTQLRAVSFLSGRSFALLFLLFLILRLYTQRAPPRGALYSLASYSRPAERRASKRRVPQVLALLSKRVVSYRHTRGRTYHSLAPFFEPTRGCLSMRARYTLLASWWCLRAPGRIFNSLAPRPPRTCMRSRYTLGGGRVRVYFPSSRLLYNGQALPHAVVI